MPAAAPTLDPTRVALILLTIVLGLALDTQVGLAGQMLLSAIVWAVFFVLLAPLAAATRAPLVACLLIATLGELLLSLVWGLYTYRLGNIPLFVPPGHVLLFLLGLSLAQRLSARAADLLIAAAGIYSLLAAVAGIDSFGLLLFALLLLAALAMPRHRRLYASTFLLALGLELVGTGLGNWTWAPAVPGLPLVTTNPPLAAGAFYSALDALVTLVVSLLWPAQATPPTAGREPRLSVAAVDD
jgi:hypothetical protein